LRPSISSCAPAGRSQPCPFRSSLSWRQWLRALTADASRHLRGRDFPICVFPAVPGTGILRTGAVSGLVSSLVFKGHLAKIWILRSIQKCL
jgi:hypothetical protein